MPSLQLAIMAFIVRAVVLTLSVAAMVTANIEVNSGMVAAGVTTTSVVTPEPTNPLPTPMLTRNHTIPTHMPTTAQPTMAPIPASGKPTLIVSVSDSFMDFYTDPFVGSTFDEIPLPPAVISENGAVPQMWQRGQVLVPAHLDYFAFDLWHGDDASAITPYFETDYEVDVTIQGKTVKDVKLTFQEEGAMTARVEAQLICSGDLEDKEGEGKITFELKRIGYPNTRFMVKKVCEKLHHEELLVSMHSGELLFSGGEINPAYNLHDIRTPSFIASKEDQSDTLYFHTLNEQYKIVGTPTVHAFEPIPEMLKWIAKRSPGLLQATEEAAAEDEVENAADTFFNENNDANDVYGEGIDVSEEGSNTPITSLSHQDVIPTSINTQRSSKRVKKASAVCEPSLGGEVSHRPGIRITHRKDVGEAKLMGFAQAGLLGMHGARRLVVSYNCMQDGLAFIVIHAVVESMDKNSDAFRRESMRFSYLKVCSAGQIAPNLIDLMGFDVKLGMFAADEPAFYPVVNGLTTEQFSSDGLEIVVSSEESSSSFYASLRRAVVDLRKELSVEQRLRIVRVRIANRYNTLDVMRPKLSGHGAHGGIVGKEALPITVHYHCQKTGRVRTGIDLLVDVVQGKDASGEPLAIGDGVVRRISFYWTKECMVMPLSVLGARTATPELFEAPSADAMKAGVLHNGNKDKFSQFKHTQVVSHGAVQPMFDLTVAANQKKADGALKKNLQSGGVGPASSNVNGIQLFDVPADESVFAVELFKYAPKHTARGINVNKHHLATHAGLRFRAPKLISSNPNVRVSLRNIGEMERLANLGRAEFLNEEGAAALSFKQKKMARLHSFDVKNPIGYQITHENKVFLVVDHVCVSSGSAEITLELPVHSAREQIVYISWTKECSWSSSQVTAKQAGSAVIFFVVLAVVLTSAAFAVFIHKQRTEINFLEAKIDDDNVPFAPMKVQDASLT